ncbi:glycoside hydrolase family 130 protein [Cellulosispirillum alkaliphilum]|uniref:glycoside hydrolase family 130 protein n=1 Tax=Cellulosispirillum alkaliphilum TaxID=3039283 RepID=UPI003D6F99AE
MEIARTDIRLVPDPSRVLIRPFIPRGETRLMKIISRVMALPKETVKRQLESVLSEFANRHIDIESIFEHHYSMVKDYMISDLEPSRERQLLIGSLFTSEYSLECAALFNPSIVAHPDQTKLPNGSLRFIMSLRATGEGHISSISFRSGIIDKNCNISFTKTEPFVAQPQPISNSSYDKDTFSQKLMEMGLYNDFSSKIIDKLNNTFTLQELTTTLENSFEPGQPSSQTKDDTRDGLIWLARSNYEIRFSSEQEISQRIIFPTGPSEQNGIEDARFVLFTDDDGSNVYYATYTAYDGNKILPQLMATEDFLKFKIFTLNGKAAQNKGMALFPRKINGKYAMLSRQDNENLYIMYSNNIHFWHEMIPLLKPTFPWEFVQVGNCGPPIETSEGWLVLTHGVGPMRKYCIGAILLDLDNPRQVLGRLSEPLLEPNENEREGYVPNVVYTCGALIHQNKLIVPYAMSDYATGVATVDFTSLLERLKLS